MTVFVESDEELRPETGLLASSTAMSRAQRAAPWLALALLVLMGGELVAVYAESWLGIRRYTDMTPQALLAIVAARDAAQLFLALFGVYAILRAPLSSLGLRQSKVCWVALGAAIGLTTALVFPRFVHELRLGTTYHFQYIFYVISHATGLTAAASLLVYLFLVPFLEEIVFRGIVLQGLLNITNDVGAVVASAAIFGAVHAAGGVGLMVPAFCGGLFYGWLYLRTRSIVPSSVAHVVYDTVAFYPLIAHTIGAHS